jgi:hydrogenase nickel incorporation protein HypB
MKKIEVIQDVMSVNDTVAAANRQLLDSHKVMAVNIMASPGAGKTSLILATISRLQEKYDIAVMEGDVASSVDAEKIEGVAKAVIQINTQYHSIACSLIANVVNQTLPKLPLDDIDLLLIENVGNLICPSRFILGAHKRVVITSLPEGDDKPIKYPLIFLNADVVLINKIDFLPYVDFNMKLFRETLLNLNPKLKIFEISCKTNSGIDDWCAWLESETENHH